MKLSDLSEKLGKTILSMIERSSSHRIIRILAIQDMNDLVLRGHSDAPQPNWGNGTSSPESSGRSPV